jgi:hypothetical protein
LLPHWWAQRNSWMSMRKSLAVSVSLSSQKQVCVQGGLSQAISYAPCFQRKGETQAAEPLPGESNSSFVAAKI